MVVFHPLVIGKSNKTQVSTAVVFEHLRRTDISTSNAILITKTRFNVKGGILYILSVNYMLLKSLLISDSDPQKYDQSYAPMSRGDCESKFFLKLLVVSPSPYRYFMHKPKLSKLVSNLRYFDRTQ